jgi:valyl-tRNA synthetase
MKTSAAFCNKIWQASRFYFQAVQRLQTDSQKWQKYRKDVENLTENEKIDLISRRYLRLY